MDLDTERVADFDARLAEAVRRRRAKDEASPTDLGPSIDPSDITPEASMESKLQRWISEQVVGDEMLWKGAFGRQVGFIRDVLIPLAAWGLEYEDVAGVPAVISTHRSKSIVLPVVELSRPDLGLRMVVRENFYNWKLSVVSERPVEADFSGLFHTTPPVDPSYTGDPLSPVYFEGFPEDLVFGYYGTGDKRRWSAEVHGDCRLYTAVFLVMRSLGAVRPLEWHTRESHRKELDAQSAKEKARRESPGP